MKTLNYFIITLAALAFFACEKNEDLVKDNNGESVEAAENEAAMEEISDDIDEIAFYGSEYSHSSGRIAHNDENSPLFCAEITHNVPEKTIVIDYGDGCEDPRGRDRKGKIIITYNTLLFIPGAEVVVTFEDFYISGVKIEGIRRIKNISESLETFVALEVTFENGKFTWEDGSFATRNAHWILKWFRADNPIDDEKHLEGSASGSTKANIEYSVEITEPIVFKRACRPGRIFIPVQGIKVIVWNGRTKTIDYGDGECDRIVRITSEDITTQVELRARLRWRNS